MLQSALAVALVLGLWLVGSTCYLALHDDLMASLMSRQAQIQYAYEDRIASLRNQVSRESSLKLLSQSTIEAQVRELTRRAAALETRASLVSDLASRLHPNKSTQAATDGRAAPVTAIYPGVQPGSVDNPPLDGNTDAVDADRAGSAGLPMAPSSRRKPRPVANLGRPAGPALAQSEDRQPLALRLAAVTETLEHVDASQYSEIASVGDRARRRVEAIRTLLADVGVAPERLAASVRQPDVGGPYVPLDPAVENSAFGRAYDTLQADIVAADSLSQALPRIPFARPLTGSIEVTSPYGARLDPFLGRAAMHTGVDLREDYGTAVRATAAGRVISAGPAGGYGVMVEIDHGHGLSTRYAHLSEVSVQLGQAVARGETVGQVGATGRATGPHLHYETRIDGEAVDPMRFLAAGDKLAAVVALP